MSRNEINAAVRRVAYRTADRTKSCHRKVWHDTPQAADAAAREMSLRHRDEDFQAYQCRHGPHWHVGHAIYDDAVEVGDGGLVGARPVFRGGRELSRRERVAELTKSAGEAVGGFNLAPSPTAAEVGDFVRPASFVGHGFPVTLAGHTTIDVGGRHFVLRPGGDYERTW